MTITILKAVLVIIVLAIMILVLLAINHLFSGNLSARESDTDKLREDIRESEEVISGNSAFRELVKVRERNVSRRDV